MSNRKGYNRPVSTDILKKVPAVRRNVTTRVMGNEAFVMSLDTVKTYSMNETASKVWTLIDGVRTVRDIIRLVTDEYDVPENDCRSSVIGIIRQFSDEQLVNFPDRHD